MKARQAHSLPGKTPQCAGDAPPTSGSGSHLAPKLLREIARLRRVGDDPPLARRLGYGVPPKPVSGAGNEKNPIALLGHDTR